MRDSLLFYRSGSDRENETDEEYEGDEYKEQITLRQKHVDLLSEIKKERQYALFSACYKIIQHSGVTRPSFNMWGDSRGGGDFKLLASYILSCIFMIGNNEDIDLAFGYLLPYGRNIISYPNLLLSVQQLYIRKEFKSYNITFFDSYIFNYIDYIAEVVKLFIFLEELHMKLQDENVEASDDDEEILEKLEYDYTYLENTFSKINKNMHNISSHKKVTISIIDIIEKVKKEIISKTKTHNILILKVIKLLSGIELSETTVLTKNIKGFIIPEISEYEFDYLEDYSYFSDIFSILDTLDYKEVTTNNSLFMDCCLKAAVAYDAGFTNSGGNTGITSNPKWSFLSENPLLKSIRNHELVSTVWVGHEISFPIDTPLHIIYFYSLISSNPLDTTAIVPIATPEFPWSLLKEKGFLYAKHMYYTNIYPKNNVEKNEKQTETRKRNFSEIGESSSKPITREITKVGEKSLELEKDQSSFLFGSLEDMNAFFISNPCYKIKFEDYKTIVRLDKYEHLKMMFLKSIPTESQLISLFSFANSEKIMSFLVETSLISGYDIRYVGYTDDVKPHLTKYIDDLIKNFEHLEKSFKIDDTKFKFGLEIECCFPSNEYAKLNLKYFDTVDDSSIVCGDRNTVRTEFVYKGTFTLSDLDNEEFIKEVKELGENMIEGDDNSCGTHVHMSCEINFQKKQNFIKSLQKSWILLQEDFISNWYGEEREVNEYCVPNEKVLEPEEYRKYMMLNLKPTIYEENEVHVEFRGLPYVYWWKHGTGNLKKYLNSLCDVWNRAAFTSRFII